MSGIPTYSHGGLAKLSMLKGVDYIIYTESQNTSPNPKHVCLDVMFWRGIFEHFFPKKKIEYIPVGSKAQIESIFKAIKAKGKIKSIYLTRDRDYDHAYFSKTELKKYNICTTYGYSWENDIFLSDASFLRLIYSYGLNDKDFIKRDFQSTFLKANATLKRFIKCDFILTQFSSSFFIRKTSHGNLIKFDCSHRPYFCKRKALEIVRHNKSRIGKIKKAKKFPSVIKPQRDCYGKIMFNFYYYYLRFIFNDQTGAAFSVNKDNIARQAICIFHQDFKNNRKSLQYKHYENFLR